MQVHELAPSPFSFSSKFVDVPEIPLLVELVMLRLLDGRDPGRWWTFVTI